MVNVELRDIEPDEVPAPQGLIESDPDRARDRSPVRAGRRAEPSHDATPEVAEEDKRVLGAWLNGSLVAVVDLVRGFPDEDTVHIGLLQVHGEQQRQGLGKQRPRAGGPGGMNDRIPHTERDHVLVDVKAKPSGWAYGQP
jgi:predicted N-acetyltransferase YhbS